MADAYSSLSARRKVLGAKIETTKGTFDDPATAAALTNVYDLKMEPDNMFGDGERQPNGHYFGSIEAVRGPKIGKCTFRTEMAHDDIFMTLAPACGFVVAGLVATPTSDISLQKTLSLCVWEGGRKKTMCGASGTFTIEPGGPGQRVFANWEFTGIFIETADEAMPARAEVQTVGYIARSMTLTIAAVEIPHVSQFSLAVNAEPEPRQDVTSTEGIAHYLIGDLMPTLTLDPEARTVAQYDEYGLLIAGTAQALSMVLSDPSGNTFTIAAPKVQRTSVTDGEREKKLVQSVEFGCRVSSGNDQVTLTKATAA